MSASGGRTFADVGEFGVISALTSRLAPGEHVVVGPGDDAAVLRIDEGPVVGSVDMLVQDRHFRLDWSSADDIGHKAAAANLSDINAMGGQALALLVALGAPASLDVGWALQLADGLAAEAELVGASVVGGDLTSADTIVLAVTVLGVCRHGVVPRSGASPGDAVALAGRQGWAAAGFAVLGRGFRSPRAVVDAHRRPAPPYHAGPAAAAAGATAMIDVSDGLLQDLGHVATSSGVAVDIESALLEVPEPLQAVGAALGVDPLSYLLTGGDDYSLVATFPPQAPLPSGWHRIGRVKAEGEAGSVTVDGSAYDGDGHRHFR